MRRVGKDDPEYRQNKLNFYMIKYFSTFSGIAGFELGIGGGVECVGFSEVDKYAIQIYQRHFPEHKNYGDITKIIAAELPDFDLYVGGFPCQAFSIAGKRRGFEDTRGTLFFDVARILKEKRPRNFILENVKGLLSHDDGRTFKTIITTLADLGYCVEWQVLNSKNFGVPQNRERVFIVGHLGDFPGRKVFPIREDSQSNIVLPTLTTRYYGGQANGGYIGNKTVKVGTYRTHKDGQGFRESKGGLSPTIPARAREDGSGQPVIMVAVKTVRTEESKRIRRESAKKGKDWSPRQGYELSARSDDLMNTITANWEINQSVTDGLQIRRLTPIECERLQGFPDNWTQIGRTIYPNGVYEDLTVSDTQRYKCLGNAVTVNVIKAIIEKLI